MVFVSVVAYFIWGLNLGTVEIFDGFFLVRKGLLRALRHHISLGGMCLVMSFSF